MFLPVSQARIFSLLLQASLHVFVFPWQVMNLSELDCELLCFGGERFKSPADTTSWYWWVMRTLTYQWMNPLMGLIKLMRGIIERTWKQGGKTWREGVGHVLVTVSEATLLHHANHDSLPWCSALCRPIAMDSAIHRLRSWAKEVMTGNTVNLARPRNI